MDLRDKCSNSALEFFKDETISREEKDKLFKDITKLYFDSLKQLRKIVAFFRKSNRIYIRV